MPNIRKILINFILPLAAVIILSFVNSLLAVIFLIIYIIYILYAARAGIFALIGKMRYSRGSVEDALVWFDRAYRTGKARPKTVISYAYLLLKSRNIGKAENILNKILGMANLETDAKMLAKSNLALVLWKKDNLDEAITMLEEVYKDFKTSVIYGSLGYLLILKGDLDRALKFNLEAYEYNDSNGIILDNLGLNYYLIGDYDRAEEIYEKLIPSNPVFPEAYYNYGLTLAGKGKLEKALETVKKAQNYYISFLSTVTREEIESKIVEIESKINEISGQLGG